MVESPRAVNLADVAQEEFFPEIPNSLRDAMTLAVESGARAIAVTAASGLGWVREQGGLPQRMLMITRIEAPSLPAGLVRLVRTGYAHEDLLNHSTLLIHQRLVRKLCATCRTDDTTAEHYAARLGIGTAEARQVTVQRGAGCDECRLTPGFRGRVPLARSIQVGRTIAEALATGSRDAVMAACGSDGNLPFRDEGLQAIAAGLTTPEEIIGA